MPKIRAGRYVGEAQGLTFSFRVERREGDSLIAWSGDVTRGTRFLASFVGEEPVRDEDNGRLVSAIRFRGHPRLSTGAMGLDVDERGRGIFQFAVDLAGGYRDGFAGVVEWRGSDLRKLLVEIDGIEGTAPPGTYTTPSGEEVGLSQAFASAGFDVEVRVDSFQNRGPDRTRIRGWTLAELHAAMEDVRAASPADRIHAHVLVASYMAGRDNRGVLGIMYDFDRDDLNNRPREGVAVFYDHPLLSDPRVPVAARDREFVFTVVHELGHALNLMHSFDKARPSALSWMNYPDLYPLGYEAGREHDGTAEFWRHFTESFDDDELQHLRHATPREIRPGGLPFGTYEDGLSTPFGGEVDPHRPAPGANPLRESFDVELSLKPVDAGKTSYQLGEPVMLAIGVQNVGDRPVHVPHALDPSEGYVNLSIRHPSGRVQRFRPPVRMCKTAQQVRLVPNQALSGHPGTPLFLSAEGAVFTEPGTYQIAGELMGIDGCRVAYSQPLNVRVEAPARKVERFAEIMFESPRLLEPLYLRHPLADLDGFRRLREAAKKQGLHRDDANTTWSYLNYIGALGWMTPFVRPRQRTEEGRDLDEARKELEDVKTTKGLPRSVESRMKALEELLKDDERKRRCQASVAGGLAPVDATDVARAEVPASGFFGSLGVSGVKEPVSEGPSRSPLSPFVRVVDGFRGYYRFADVVTWNIEHLHSRRYKIPQVAELIRSFRCDFWGLQEIGADALSELVDTLNSQGSVRYAARAVAGGGQQNGCLWRTDTTTVDILDLPSGIDWDDKLDVEYTNGDVKKKKVFHRDPMLASVRVRHGNDKVFDFRTAIVHLKSTDSKMRDRGASLRDRGAQLLAEWLADDRARTGEFDYLLLGDMNAETGRQGLQPFLDDSGLDLLSVGMQQEYGEENALTRVASERLLDHIVVTSDALLLTPEQDLDEQIIIRSDRRLADFTSEYSDHVPVAVRFIIGEDDD